MASTASSSRSLRLGASGSPSGDTGVIRLALPETDVALVAALKVGRTDAKSALFDRYGADVERVLYRVLGPDNEIPDLLHDVFLAALLAIHTLRQPEALRGWLTGIAVRKARKCIRRRRRWRFIQPRPPEELPEQEAVTPPIEVSEALRATYKTLAELPADERIPFALRFIDGMELTAVAAACGVSLATIKRRLSRAQRTFAARGARYGVLTEWIERGGFGQ